MAGTGPTIPDPPPKNNLLALLSEASWQNDVLVHDGEVKFLALRDGVWTLAADGDHRLRFSDYMKLLNLHRKSPDAEPSLTSDEDAGTRWAVVPTR